MTPIPWYRDRVKPEPSAPSPRLVVTRLGPNHFRVTGRHRIAWPNVAGWLGLIAGSWLLWFVVFPWLVAKAARWLVLAR